MERSRIPAKPMFDYGEILLKASELTEDLKAQVPRDENIVDGDEIDFNVTMGDKVLWSATAVVTSETPFPLVFLIPKEVFLELIKPASIELHYVHWMGGGGNNNPSARQKVVVV